MVSARHLPKMDTFGSCDAFVVVALGEEAYQTQVVKGSYAPDWGEALLFHLHDAAAAPAPLTVTVMDWDRSSNNDVVGSASVPADVMVCDPSLMSAGGFGV